MSEEAPERIHGWMNSQMSVARFFGGIEYMGHRYLIVPNEVGAPLVRVDILRDDEKARRKEKREKAIKVQPNQWDLL